MTIYQRSLIDSWLTHTIAIKPDKAMAFSYASFITFGALLFTVMILCVCVHHMMIVCYIGNLSDCMTKLHIWYDAHMQVTFVLCMQSFLTIPRLYGFFCQHALTVALLSMSVAVPCGFATNCKGADEDTKLPMNCCCRDMCSVHWSDMLHVLWRVSCAVHCT